MTMDVFLCDAILEHKIFDQLDERYLLRCCPCVHWGFSVKMQTSDISNSDTLLVAILAVCTRLLYIPPIPTHAISVNEKMIANILPSLYPNMVISDGFNGDRTTWNGASTMDDYFFDCSHG